MPDPGLLSCCLMLALTAGNEGVVTLTRPAAAPMPGSRHFVVQVRILEVDEQGRATVVATPTVQTTGAAAGVTIDAERNRRFEFHFTATADGAPSPLPVVIGDEAAAPKPIAVAASTTVEIDRALERRVTVRATQQARKDVLREVAKQAGLRIVLDPDAVGLAPLFSPVSLQLENVPLDLVLKQLLLPLELGYTVHHDLVLIAPTEPASPVPAPVAVREAAAVLPDAWQVKVYDVSDLVTKNPTTGRPDFEPILKQLRTNVTPKSWDTSDGEATARGFDSTVSLVIRQTNAGHDAVADYLSALRKKSVPPANP
jgi:hypothetical protein